MSYIHKRPPPGHEVYRPAKRRRRYSEMRGFEVLRVEYGLTTADHTNAKVVCSRQEYQSPKSRKSCA